MLADLGEIGVGKAGGLASTRSSGQPSISPTYFKRKVDRVAWAALDFGSTHQMPKVRKASAKAGLKFEDKVCKELQAAFGPRFARAVPISFQEEHSHSFSRPAFAIPDGLLLSGDGRSLLCIEIKLRHSSDAWFQLNRFYLPILRRVVGNSLRLFGAEICLHYDPAARVPVEKTIVSKLEDAFKADPKMHCVLLWEKF